MAINLPLKPDICIANCKRALRLCLLVLVIVPVTASGADLGRSSNCSCETHESRCGVGFHVNMELDMVDSILRK